MDAIWILCIPILLALMVLAVLMRISSRPRDRSRRKQEKSLNTGLRDIKGRSPVRGEMQDMFRLLTDTLADHIILSKVAFTSLVSTDNEETKASLITKTADFVVCTAAFKVVAVVFFNPARPSSKSRNARIDAIMRRAGHRVLRYAELPKRAKLAIDIKRPPSRPTVRPRYHELPNFVAERQALYGERRHKAERRSGITYIDDNFIERRDLPDRRQQHANVTHMGGFIERQRSA